MARYTFWILLGAVILAAAAVNAVTVGGRLELLETATRELDDRAIAIEAKVDPGVGPVMIASLNERQERARSDLVNLRRRFAEIDEDDLDVWFADIDLPWAKLPKVEDFRRAHALARDRLARELIAELRSRGQTDTSVPLLALRPLDQEGNPGAELRAAQRDFRVQEHVLHCLVRAGARLTSALRADVADSGASGPAGGYFDRHRYDITVYSETHDVRNVLHAFDGPIEVRQEDGSLRPSALPIVVDNLAVKRLIVDNSVVNRYRGEPPLEITFYLTVLDFRADKAR